MCHDILLRKLHKTSSNRYTCYVSSFPLQQARQAYRSMDVELRRSLLAALEAAAPKHKLPVPTRATFLLQRPHAPPLAALDTVYAVMGLIENVSTRRYVDVDP